MRNDRHLKTPNKLKRRTRGRQPIQLLSRRREVYIHNFIFPFVWPSGAFSLARNRWQGLQLMCPEFKVHLTYFMLGLHVVFAIQQFILFLMFHNIERSRIKLMFRPRNVGLNKSEWTRRSIVHVLNTS